MLQLREAAVYLKTLDAEQLLKVAAALSLGAAFIHGFVTPEHFEEWWGYGLFFLVATFLQGFYGLLLIFQPWQPDPIRETSGFSARLLYQLGIWGNAAIIVLYVITRTVGIPFFGPEAGEIEEVTLLSMTSKIVEIALILCLLMLLRRTDQRRGDLSMV